MTDQKTKNSNSKNTKTLSNSSSVNNAKTQVKSSPERKHKSQISEYGQQLREKQKIKNIYGISEKQFSNYVKSSTKNTGDNVTTPSLQIYRLLEMRLDNVVFRLGFAKTRPFARQMVSHGHIIVNGKKINIPSYIVKLNDIISIRPGSFNTKLFTNIKTKIENLNTEKWIEYDKEKLIGKIINKPSDIDDDFDITKVLEFYSK